MVLKEEAEVKPGKYSIKPGAQRKLGSNYEQSPFSIRFTTTKLSKIVALLEELTQGQSSLLLTKLDISKSRRADKLTVNINVSSINASS